LKDHFDEEEIDFMNNSSLKFEDYSKVKLFAYFKQICHCLKTNLEKKEDLESSLMTIGEATRTE